ncbi:hypothetical protein NQ095_08065 [Rossellomorea sp. SC111]|uniref:hypothetical protein n=1 Tax=Rossellomorea sp. SC111 TaxID=2968985 RepID=UPI00215B45E3|nr:hypothetical protein [Rossellomorea sp. SC111]MCR8848353.1 hypothetical protein [Rossellomorea sp. SC111]
MGKKTLKLKPKILKLGQMTPCFMMKKYVQTHSHLLPYKIMIKDNFQINSYSLVVKDYKLAHTAQGLTAQHYISIHKHLEKFLNKETCDYSVCFCPIYFITITEAKTDDEIQLPLYKTEKLVYVGQTNSVSPRFIDGHKATQKLNEFEFNNYIKTVYMTQVCLDISVNINGEKQEYKGVPLELISFEEKLVPSIIDFIEKFLIFGLRPQFNEVDNPVFQNDEYIKEPKHLSIKALKPEHFKVKGSRNTEQLLHDLDIIDQIRKMGHPWEESIEFFEKIGFIPTT